MKTCPLAVVLAAILVYVPSVFGAASATQRNVQMTEVNFTNSTITLKNLHPTATVDMSAWRFCSHDDDQVRRYSASGGMGGLSLAPGETLTIWWLNNSPGGSENINRSSIGGNFATALDRGPYAIQLYDGGSFGSGANIVDHLQWSIGGADNTSADDRSDEAQSGGMWTNQGQWISTTATASRILLTAEDGSVTLHGPASYTVVEPETVLPTLVSIDDTTWPSSATVGDAVDYTVTFDEAMHAATVGVEDFENRDDAGITVDSVSVTGDPAVFDVTVTTTAPGDLTLQIKAGAFLTDLAGNTLATTAALEDLTTIEVVPLEMDPPGLVSIVDSTFPSSATVGDSVAYTVTFDEAMDASTVGTTDFENGDDAGIAVTSVTPTGDPAVFDVSVATLSAGNLTLQIKAGAVMKDLVGNELDTTGALPDDTTILVVAPPPGNEFDTWAVSNGVPPNSETVDSDEGGKNNFYEFSLGGQPGSAVDDGSLLHHFVADGDGDLDDDAVLTILVRSGAVFVADGASQTATKDGVKYTIYGGQGLDPVSGVNVLLATIVIDTDLPAAPDGYEYVSFLLEGSVGEGLASGYFRVKVEPGS